MSAKGQGSFAPFPLYKPPPNLQVTHTPESACTALWGPGDFCAGYRLTCPLRNTGLKKKNRGKKKKERKKTHLLMKVAVKLAGLEVVCIVMSCSSSHQSDPTQSVFLSLHFNWLVVKFFKHCETADIHCNIM